MTKNKNHIRALIDVLKKINSEKSLKKMELLKLKYAI